MPDIADLDREIVLAVLYNAAGPRGRGFLKYDPVPMDRAGARRAIGHRGSDILADLPFMRRVMSGPPYLSFDYLFGRPLKVSLHSDAMDASSYDRIHGERWAERALASYRATGTVDSPEILNLHLASLEQGGREAREWLDEETRLLISGRQRLIMLGPGEHAGRLRAILRDLFDVRH